MIRISVCHHVCTGWLTTHVKGLSRWGQYVEFTLSLGCNKKSLGETVSAGNVQTDTKKLAAVMLCTKWIPVGHVSRANTEEQCALSQQLMQPGLSRNALLCNKYSSGGIWIVLIRYRQAGSDGSFRAGCALRGTIQSRKICQQHQIIKREHWLCSWTICYCCVPPEHVICQWVSSRWIEALRSCHLEDSHSPVALCSYAGTHNATEQHCWSHLQCDKWFKVKWIKWPFNGVSLKRYL